MKKVGILFLLFFSNVRSQDIFFPEWHRFQEVSGATNTILRVSNDSIWIFSSGILNTSDGHLRIYNLNTNQPLRELKVDGTNSSYVSVKNYPECYLIERKNGYVTLRRYVINQNLEFFEKGSFTFKWNGDGFTSHLNIKSGCVEFLVGDFYHSDIPFFPKAKNIVFYSLSKQMKVIDSLKFIDQPKMQCRTSLGEGDTSNMYEIYALKSPEVKTLFKTDRNGRIQLIRSNTILNFSNFMVSEESEKKVSGYCIEHVTGAIRFKTFDMDLGNGTIDINPQVLASKSVDEKFKDYITSKSVYDTSGRMRILIYHDLLVAGSMYAQHVFGGAYFDFRNKWLSYKYFFPFHNVHAGGGPGKQFSTINMKTSGKYTLFFYSCRPDRSDMKPDESEQRIKEDIMSDGEVEPVVYLLTEENELNKSTKMGGDERRRFINGSELFQDPKGNIYAPFISKLKLLVGSKLEIMVFRGNE